MISFSATKHWIIRELIELEETFVRFNSNWNSLIDMGIYLKVYLHFTYLIGNHVGHAVMRVIHTTLCPATSQSLLLWFQGSSCESCSPGYTRFSPEGGSETLCVPCNCNSQSNPVCDSVTGECYCTRNSTGSNCDKCLEGFYGDPTQTPEGKFAPAALQTSPNRNAK